MSAFWAAVEHWMANPLSPCRAWRVLCALVAEDQAR